MRERFSGEFDRYRAQVPKYFPGRVYMGRGRAFGRNLPLKELGTAWGIVIGGFFFEWIESPPHRQWISGLYNWMTKGVIQ